jgi:hypothetical protein
MVSAGIISTKLILTTHMQPSDCAQFHTVLSIRFCISSERWRYWTEFDRFVLLHGHIKSEQALFTMLRSASSIFRGKVDGVDIPTIYIMYIYPGRSVLRGYTMSQLQSALRQHIFREHHPWFIFCSPHSAVHLESRSQNIRKLANDNARHPSPRRNEITPDVPCSSTENLSESSQVHLRTTPQ